VFGGVECDALERRLEINFVEENEKNKKIKEVKRNEK